ncbi:CusA/CzcA family heavy metal efflux RND transporter [Formosa maritima]|uniref:CusA/CzcA family heavy metal efflux RND transporter n=1 Tax=Formosa maritima TaxID=2592046 RepID=A0A5D0GMW6_9FLAO|nr:CusA/CzcA family heavy metal efflux RND transporter [Formosa maritima]TYA60060.1 CusA/CzcA family heavy metal efflux RND transporter [Formosa maritima]
MLENIIKFSLKNKLIILLFMAFVVGFGIFSITQIPIGAVPDITNNQVQVITTSRNLSTQDVEQFITYPVELEMANLPGVVEIRSVSKFGLSVVTIVFEDDLGTYLPRQLIAEKIKSASEKIPEGFGSPEMGPITTGLGEIYQYILDIKPEFKDRYSTTDLRTIQDWVVKRQLSGIPGVVEVNTWGGFLKQYEVAINPQKLDAINITVSEIYTALEKNNSVAGGGYIEKSNQAFFIRGEGLIESLEDIGNIVVKNDGIPIFIKDIAKVGFGSATRFGAITGNGEGEKVLGQIMMLKDGNSKQIIDDVKERITSIQNSLPEGVYINGFLERSELINKTTFTVAENLILGSLIVIFVVVLLLGNWRSGLVVASVIPLSLLFAISLMNIFGIDANLMSLGAIDFGIIIDGAVIIVEYIAFQITAQSAKIKSLSKVDQQADIDTITLKSSSKMMNSAIFGQLIILIVFIPILSLSGVEGKMFKPMAMTFSFALVGAMIFCLTYVPVISSMFLKPSVQSDRNISVRLMATITKAYKPIINWALSNKRIVISLSVILLTSSIWIFSRMGGEFVPTLDEGDFVIQPVLKTGTSLSKTIEITTRIEQILLDNFPEVDQVVSRIGAAEVPTDPMSMEESDVIIKLKPIKQWVSASNKDELADKFKEALEVIPDMEVEFTQPIEMRFNELITGVRADVAIKIFGEDLNILANKANEIRNLIEHVEGASDIIIEKVEGLPQMSVSFSRSKIARYGLNIADLNQMITMGFSGDAVGSVFEGEKRFDLVIRLEEDQRKNLESLQYLYVDLPNNEGKIPLSELAEITYTTGPAKISRDDTKRRIVVGINVRNRDLQSVVNDVKTILDKDLELPVGYTITYGGQFENLQSAKARLMVAVPIALILIFILLHFAFGSIKEALMVYSAIPLSAVGGILLLWIRDLPFSISAGVGFIALFGIAVLNGIVLIEHFKELKEQGMTNIEKLIKRGTTERLRPVLLTAAAAALGFLPMAISTNAGAEVQRPLATVVIGGLVSATILTLVVLPVLYAWFETKKNMKVNKKGIASVIVLLISIGMNAQQNPIDVTQTLKLAIENNSGLKAWSLKVDEADALIESAFNFDKTSLYYNYDESNLVGNNDPLNVFGISQDFKFPTVYFADKKVNKAQHLLQESQYNIQIQQLKRDVYAKYYQLSYTKNKAKAYHYLDSLYQNFAKSAERRFELGETNYLEMITAKSKQKQLETLYKQALQDIVLATEQLKKVVQIDNLSITDQPLKKLELETVTIANNIGLETFEFSKIYYKALNQKEKQSLLPDLNVEYFQGTNSGIDKNFIGYTFGVKIPLFFSGNTSKIKASKIAQEVAEEQQQDYQIRLDTEYQSLLAKLQQNEEAINYYETQGKTLSEEIIKTAERTFKEGEIDFFQYIQSIETAKDIELTYLDNLNTYNQTIIAINYLIL